MPYKYNPKYQPSDLFEIDGLQRRIDALRKDLHIAAKDECLWRRSLNSCDDDEIIVVADGLGGAMVSQVDGNWPVDCMCANCRVFVDEHDACEFAESITDEGVGDGSWEDAERIWDKDHPPAAS